ncbi:MAG: PilZ domain-containing protein [Bdellovibrionales bacterium]|nr:PilZ domain-containing protein [Bdellovibrionales bacterium]
MNESAAQDRRRHLRIPLEQEVLVERENFEGIEKVNTFNLSPAGACLSSNKSFATGQIVYLEIKNRDQIDCIPSMGEVKWTKELPEGSWLSGVEFRGISSKFKNRIHSFILKTQVQNEKSNKKSFPSEDSQEQLFEYLEKSDPQGTQTDPLEHFPDMDQEAGPSQDDLILPQDTLINTTSVVKALRDQEESQAQVSLVSEPIESELSTDPIWPWKKFGTALIVMIVLTIFGYQYGKRFFDQPKNPSDKLDQLVTRLYQNSKKTKDISQTPVSVKNLPGSKDFLAQHPIDMTKPASILRDIQWKDSDQGGSLVIETNGNTEDLTIRSFFLSKPSPRKVFVFEKLTHDFDQKVFPISKYGISQIRLGRHGNENEKELHFVIDVENPNLNFVLEKQEAQIKILVSDSDK